MRVALPTMLPGGLEAQVAQHFGHCQSFTVVTLEGGQVAGVEVIPNGHHEQGACGAPVKRLLEAGVTTIVVGGIGRRPLEMFLSQGAKVFMTQAVTVAEAIGALTQGRLTGFDASQACGGGASGGSGHCGNH